ncbi:MAG: ATP-binding protein [Methylomonas lenta]|nr:ATP-binding protein [Methylomonas lenta]
MYQCTHRLLLQVLGLAKGDGSLKKLFNQLSKADVLILDDCSLVKLIAEPQRDCLKILEDRHYSRSTLVTSQLLIEQWHDSIGVSTLADDIMDRLVHNAYKINLKGESLRKKQTHLTTNQEIE